MSMTEEIKYRSCIYDVIAIFETIVTSYLKKIKLKVNLGKNNS